MPVIYETTVKIVENGRLSLNIDDLPFDAGTQFLVKLIPQTPFHAETFKERMQALIKECSRHNPYQGMTKDQILAELRRQREAMDDEPTKN